MQVKTFTGSSTHDVMAQVKAELGPEAVILSSREIYHDGRQLFEITAGVERKEVPQNSSVPPGWEEWHREWSRVKDHLYTLMQPALPWDRLNPRQRVALEYLQREGVENEIVVELYQAMQEGTSPSSMLTALAELVPVARFSEAMWPQRVHVLTGPFGAGKTTTALRLGMQLRAERPDMSIAYFNADCSRGNGRLILRHWTELSDFDYYETPDPLEMGAAFKLCQNHDRIFIDLPGLDRTETLEEKLSSLGLDGLAQNNAMAVHLTLPPHYSSQQLGTVLRRHQTDMAASLIWTKLDEAVSFGQLVNVAVRSKLPVSALSHGPELQGSLTPAEESLLWRVLLKRELPGSRAGKAA